jgi:hypothetical protein
MAAAHQLGFHRLQLGRHLLLVRDPLYPEPSLPGRPGDLPESQERERLRLPLAPRFPHPGRVRPGCDQPGLAGVQFQAEFREPSAQFPQEPLASSWYSNPTMKSSANRVTMTFPRACVFLQ